MITDNAFCATPEKHYNLRNYNDFRVLFERNVYHGTANISYSEPQIWDIGSIELNFFSKTLFLHFYVLNIFYVVFTIIYWLT